MRYSKQREAVYGVLCATTTHPDVQWVYKQVRKAMPNISLGTVYRNLEELCLLGRAKKLGVAGSAERFDARTEPHTHFVCTRCGSVCDVDCSGCFADGYRKCDCGKVSSAEIMLYGVCKNCLEGICDDVDTDKTM